MQARPKNRLSTVWTRPPICAATLVSEKPTRPRIGGAAATLNPDRSEAWRPLRTPAGLRRTWHGHPEPVLLVDFALARLSASTGSSYSREVEVPNHRGQRGDAT